MIEDITQIPFSFFFAGCYLMPAVAKQQRLIVPLAALVVFDPLSIEMYLPSLPMVACSALVGVLQD